MKRIAAMVLVAGLGVSSLLGGVAGCGTESGSDFPEGSSGASGASGGSSGPGITPGGGDGGMSSGGSGGPGTSGGPSCATATARTERQPVYLDIVLDGSGSMDGWAGRNYVTGSREADPLAPGRTRYVCNDRSNHGGGGNNGGNCPSNVGLTGKKWLAARGALKAFFDSNAPAASPSLGVGMYLFSSTNPGREDFRVLDAAHATELWARIAPETWPNGGTPLGDSIDEETDRLRDWDPALPLAPGGRRAILLIADGVPDGGNSEKNRVRTAVEEALGGSPSVATAVIGVGDPAASSDVFDATFLSRLAKAGGVSAAGCNENWAPGSATPPCHLQVTPGEKTAQELQVEITAAINGIAGSLASCELALDKTSPIDPTKVNVLYVDAAGSSQIPQDPQNGWSYDNPADPSSVILHGQACDRLKADDGARVDIVIGCPTGDDVVN